MKKIFSDNNLLDDANDNATTIMPIFAEVEGNPDIECPGVAEVDLPILPLRNMVMYPGVALPVSVGRAKSLQLIKEAYAQKQYIGVTCQKDMYVDEPEYKDLYEIGTIAEIVKILERDTERDRGITVPKECQTEALPLFYKANDVFI